MNGEHVAKLRFGAAGLALGVGLGLLSGCTAGKQSALFTDVGVAAGSFQLVAFDSCDEALTGLRTAAKAAVGPYGFGAGPVFAMEGDARGEAGAPAQPPAAAGADAPGGTGRTESQPFTPDYSGTNTHEAGVDEPDLVKTDGRRIVTVSAGVLRVVDAAGRYLTGSVDLAGSFGDRDVGRFVPAQLLLAGDKALVLMDERYVTYAGAGPAIQPDVAEPPNAAPPMGPGNPDNWPILGPNLILVDLAGAPRVLSTFRIEGALVDARQVGAIARIVVRSAPRFSFPYDVKGDDAERLAANRATIDQSELEDWLPRMEVTTAGQTDRPQIDCTAINRPATYTGTNLLTVLTFDLAAANLAAAGLGDGQPTTLVADGDTVYSNGPSLYVASDRRWRMTPMGARPDAPTPDARTEIYKFDTTSAGRPTFVAGGGVPGYLINQYAMSEWEGYLRVATTANPSNGGRSQSGVYVLAQDRKRLQKIGSVEGLGKGERIYAVRFTGPIGYVVTFRQVDPLYTLDLRDPTRPAVLGELKIPGYSAYLHPAGGTRLIGIGQNADDFGRVSGMQVSLFDVADLAKPKRLAAYTLSGANSEAEFDPHAFLYWPTDALLVVPLQVNNAAAVPGFDPGKVPSTAAMPPPVTMPTVGALVLRVSGDSIAKVGFLRHPGAANSPNYPGYIRRSLVIGQTLWTVSDGGLMANDTRTLAPLAWISFT